VVLALLSVAILAERSAMGERRARAEHAFRKARQCALECLESSLPPGTSQRRQCSDAARSAAESALELPEHRGPELELEAALTELALALEAEDAHSGPRLSSALARTSRAGSALGWQIPTGDLR
jgi:hypothetical protein